MLKHKQLMTTKFVLKLKELISTIWNLQDPCTRGRGDWQVAIHLLCTLLYASCTWWEC